MTTIPSGAVKFSDIQTVMGGANPIKFSEYYADATEGYATGVSGIPNKNTQIKVSHFQGKSKGITPPGTNVYTTVGAASWTVPSGINRVDVLIVAGGGGGGYAGDRTAGGGGGGGVIYKTNETVTPGTNISITVGDGGASQANGGNSVFGSWTAIGGGAGATSRYGSGYDGGSGGGGCHTSGTTGGSGTSGQGNNGGGAGYDSGSPTGQFTGSGGGGAGGVGSAGSSTQGGNGGSSISWTVNGVAYSVGGGGGGSAQALGGQSVLAGAGGTNAGNGAKSTTETGARTGGSGTANRGGGGGGGASGGDGGSGGSGIVVVKYYTAAPSTKIYIFAEDYNTKLTTLKTNIETIASSIGVSVSVSVTAAGATGASTVLSYDSTVDVLVYWNYEQTPSGRGTAIQSYLDNGKGVVMCVYGHTSYSSPFNVGLSTTYQITNSASYSSFRGGVYPQTNPTSHPILNGVTSVTTDYYNTNFASINSATVIGSGPGGGLVMYKDYGTIRRVDINTFYDNGESTTYERTRLLLNACLWAAKKT